MNTHHCCGHIHTCTRTPSHCALNVQTSNPANIWAQQCVSLTSHTTHKLSVYCTWQHSVAALAVNFAVFHFFLLFFSHNNHQVEFLLRCDSKIYFRTTILLNWKRGSQLPLRFIIIIRYSMHALPVRQLSCFVFRFVGERNFTIHTTSVVEARSVAL